MIEDINRANAGPGRLRLDFLDALRGLAALYVMIYHMVLLPTPELALPRWAQIVAHAGGMGVALFFVVSAFSLFYTMPLRLREPRPWLSFFLHRFFRIAPLFYVWIVEALIRDRRAGHGLFEIAVNAGFLFNLIPQYQTGFVWASWTIGVEMLFYLSFPLFYLFAKNRWQALTLTLLLLIGWVVVQGLVVYIPTDPASQEMFLKWSVLRYLPVFGCGAIAYHLLLPHGQMAQTSRYQGVALTTIALALYVAVVNGWLPKIFGDQYYWQPIVFLFLLLGLGWAPLKLAVNRFTTFLGRISYSMYLSHPTVIALLYGTYRWIYKQEFGLTIAFVMCLAITLMAVIAASELTYRLIEAPGMKLGKRINIALRRTARRATEGEVRPA